MNYTTTQVCTAHISVNKNRVKIYRNVNGYADHLSSVFLKDGQNFEIELYNPKPNNVLAKISLNGKDISSSGIVLRPGQRVYIERFIDTPNKFEFSTYEVGDTKQNRTAIAKNGEVEVRFYDEYIQYSFGVTTITTNPCWITNWTGVNSNSLAYSTTGNVGIGTINPPSTLTVTGTSNTAFYNNASLTSSVAGSLETGRVEQGHHSNTKFSSANGSFNSYAASTETIKLLPASQKPVETSEIRNYCTNCGTRAKKTGWKFCPSCGSKF